MRRCPVCGTRLKTIDSREREKGRVGAENGATYRRKKCDNCGKRFSTVEIWQEDADLLFDNLVSARLEKTIDAISRFIVEVSSI